MAFLGLEYSDFFVLAPWVQCPLGYLLVWGHRNGPLFVTLWLCRPFPGFGVSFIDDSRT